MTSEDPWLPIIKQLESDYPLVPHDGPSGLYSAVRRMKAERDLGIPIHRRSGSAVSLARGQNVSEMLASDWEAFYAELSEELRRRYPELHARLFPSGGGGVDLGGRPKGVKAADR
jgi:hypothetical protein